MGLYSISSFFMPDIINPRTDEKGNISFTAPSGKVYNFRQPKGKDIVTLENYSKKTEEPSSSEISFFLIALLSLDGVSVEDMMEADAIDAVKVGECVATFPAFLALRAR